MATTKAQKGKTAAPASVAPQARQKHAVAASSPMIYLFTKENYIIMAIGLAVIIVGFALMTGAANDKPNVFPVDEIYSFRRITLAPMMVLIGFVIEVYAILKRPAVI